MIINNLNKIEIKTEVGADCTACKAVAKFTKKLEVKIMVKQKPILTGASTMTDLKAYMNDLEQTGRLEYVYFAYEQVARISGLDAYGEIVHNAVRNKLIKSRR